MRTVRASRGGGSRRGKREVEIKDPLLYIGLSGVVWAVLTSVAAAAFYVAAPRMAQWHRAVWLCTRSFLTAFFAVWALYLFIEALSVIFKRNLIPFISLQTRRRAHSMIYPLCCLAGGLFGLSGERVAACYLALNNLLSLGMAGRLKRGDYIILLPKCIQNSDCPRDVVSSVKNCERCGRCAIGLLSALMGDDRFRIVVVTGGHLAHLAVNSLSPSAVIAVACERELVCGLRRNLHIPIVALINRRPEGPCRNTQVDLEELEQAIHDVAGLA